MRKARLLPYIREDVFGLDTKSGQFYGWEIQKFEVQKYWKYSMGEGVKVAVTSALGIMDWSDNSYPSPDAKFGLIESIDAVGIDAIYL